MPIDCNKGAEEQQGETGTVGVQERSPESSETEAAAAPPASTSNLEELHAILNESIQNSLVEVSFSESTFVDPPAMHRADGEVKLKEESVEKEAESAADEVQEKGTPTLRRSSRLVVTPSSNGKPAKGSAEKRKLSKEKKTSLTGNAAKRRRESTASVASDMAETMPTLEAADHPHTHEEMEPESSSGSATATAELVNYGADTPLGKQLATMLASMMSSEKSSEPENRGNEGAPKLDEEEVDSLPPALSPVYRRSSRSESVAEDDCTCPCCKKTEKQITGLKKQMNEMMALLREIAGKPKRPLLSPPSPVVPTLKDALAAFSPSPLLPKKPCTFFSPKTKFRPASKAEISLQPTTYTSNLQVGTSVVSPTTMKALLAEIQGKATAPPQLKGSHYNIKKPRLVEEDDPGKEQTGFPHFNADGSPTQKYLWFASSILKHPSRSITVRNLRSYGGGNVNALFRCSSTDLIVGVLETMAKADLLSHGDKTSKDKIDWKFEKNSMVKMKDLELYGLSLTEYRATFRSKRVTS